MQSSEGRIQGDTENDGARYHEERRSREAIRAFPRAFRSAKLGRLEALLPKFRERWHGLATGFRHWLVAERGYRWLVLACACAFVELGYVFITSAGRFTNWPSYANRVDQLAEAFRAGQLHLLTEPSPALVSAQNPLDPALSNFWLWDASLYKGHYYFYFGPVPALLLAGAKAAFRISRPLGDETITVALATVELLAGAALLERLARRLFGEIPVVLVALAVVAFGLANPLPFILGRQEAYEAAIVGGHAFLLTGIALAFEAVSSAAVPRRSLWFAAGASAAWALALGCRIPLAPALPFLALTTALAMAWRHRARWKHFLKSLVALTTPLALGTFGLLYYNKARFERWLDFGTAYQLTWLDFKLSKSFVVANAYSYTLRPVLASCKFPYFFSSIGQNPWFAFPEGFTPPPDYTVYEQVAGIFITTPWAWLIVPALVLSGWRLWGAVRAKQTPSADSVSVVWAGVTLSMASSLTLVLPLCALTATMRYLGDATGALLLLASIGAFATYAAVRSVVVARRLAVVVLGIAALASAAVGLALGIQSYYEHFNIHNPELMQKLEKRYSVCATPKT